MSHAQSKFALLAVAFSVSLISSLSGCEPTDDGETSDAGIVSGPGAVNAGAVPGAGTGAAVGATAGGSSAGSGLGAPPVGSGTGSSGTAAGPAGAPPSGSGAAPASWCNAKAVFAKYCVSCHDGQGTGGAPMGLLSYADLTATSKQYAGAKIYSRVSVRMHATQMKMPPQGTVSPAEIKAVDDWIAAGAPGSDTAACAGSSGAGTGGSASTGGTGGTGGGEDWPSDCQKTYKILAHDSADASKPYRMAANAESHPGFTFDAPWGSDQVQAIAFRPVTDNKKILHHWILYQNSGTRAFLTGWAPGQDASERKMRPDVGMYVPSGPKSLYLDMHYYNLGSGSKEELDSSGVEVCVVGKDKFRPNTASVFMGFAGIGFPMVPAMANNYNLTANCAVTAKSPVHLLTASPHAHKLAVHMKFTAKVGGKDIVMHDAPFDFNEQTSHPLDQEVVLNTGDTVTTVCTYTNPTNKAINFSENTDGEMCFNFAVYYPMGALSCGGGGGLGGLLGGF